MINRQKNVVKGLNVEIARMGGWIRSDFENSKFHYNNFEEIYL